MEARQGRSHHSHQRCGFHQWFSHRHLSGRQPQVNGHSSASHSIGNSKPNNIDRVYKLYKIQKIYSTYTLIPIQKQAEACTFPQGFLHDHGNEFLPPTCRREGNRETQVSRTDLGYPTSNISITHYLDDHCWFVVTKPFGSDVLSSWIHKYDLCHHHFPDHDYPDIAWFKWTINSWDPWIAWASCSYIHIMVVNMKIIVE